jgi:hypothetical protein
MHNNLGNFTLRYIDSRHGYRQISGNEIHDLISDPILHVSVAGLPYPKHAVSQYRKYPGVCADRNNVVQSGDVSLVTCRYLCDVQTRRPCGGFTFYRKSELDGTMTSRCQLLSIGCIPERLINATSTVAFTYFKIN